MSTRSRTGGHPGKKKKKGILGLDSGRKLDRTSVVPGRGKERKLGTPQCVTKWAKRSKGPPARRKKN